MYSYERFVKELTEKYIIKLLHEKKKEFKNYPYALYATDVTFQQTNRPTGNLQEAKLYYSGKRKLYGYKVEFSVLRNGFATDCTSHVPGSIADIDVLTRNLGYHKTALRKTEEEKNNIQDDGLHSERYPDSWALIMDKGYQGALEMLRAILPTKKPPNAPLSSQERRDNKDVASDRIIVENYFGRCCSLWSLISSKYRWKEESYDYFFHLAVALTNRHAKWHPLRAEDGEFYRKYKSRLYSIGAEISEKRRTSQRLYRERKKRRLEVDFRSMVPLYAPFPDNDHEGM